MASFDSTAAELTDLRADIGSAASLSDQTAGALHWFSIVSGTLIKDHPGSFDARCRADRTLLANLKAVRAKLLSEPLALDEDLAHDLIARLMFVQFLFDRKDAEGVSALDTDRLTQFAREGVLARAHGDLESLLADYEDAYRLFRWLNRRFNGDFFPAKSPDPVVEEREWAQEMTRVKPHHLAVLSDLVGGRLSIGSGQLALWRLYAFDTIPLEFVSSIYEEFVSGPPERPVGLKRGRKRPAPGIYYTPTYLVDFILDGVLPWDGTSWDMKILDPACGSGIFLVRVFQRLVYRWRRAHPGQPVPSTFLVDLLEDKLFGVDIDKHAARVASFSLYLAMCDEIDPRRYWTEVGFPSLRGRRILASDFFREDLPGLRTVADARTYDLVVGNAPWGEKTMTTAAAEWAKKNDWPSRNKDVGFLFLGKALALTKQQGQIAMIQSAGTLLTHNNSYQARRKLYETARVDEVVIYSILRRHLFPTATSPACSVILTKVSPEPTPTTYVCPKLLFTGEDGHRIVVDDTDVHEILPSEVEDRWIWTVLIAATRRDLKLLRRIEATGSSLDRLMRSGDIRAQEGVIESETGVVHDGLRNRRVLFGKAFPDETQMFLPASALPKKHEIRVHRATDPTVFVLPQMIIKQGWRTKEKRFSAAVVLPEHPEDEKGVVCSQSYISVRALSDKGRTALAAACLTINSRLAVYHLGLTNGRMVYRPEPLVGDFLSLPFAHTAVSPSAMDGSRVDADQLVEDCFGLREPDRILIEDAIAYRLPEILRDRSAPGRKPTLREVSRREPHGTLWEYCEQFLRVMTAAETEPSRFAATVFENSGRSKIPLRVVAIHLGFFGGRRIGVEEIGTGDLYARLSTIAGRLAASEKHAPISRQRVGTVFDTVHDPATGEQIPTVYFIRPDQMRFWTRSAALRDADRFFFEGVVMGSFGIPAKASVN